MAERSNSEILTSLRGFIFDMDGTLVDSMGLWDSLYEELFAANRLTMPSDYTLAINHLKLADCAEYTVRNTPIKMTAQEIADFWHDRALEHYSSDVQLKPYAAKLLSLLSKHGVKMGVATALGEDLFAPCLRHNGVASFFSSGTSIDEVGAGKDKPDVYLREAAKLGLSPRQCAVVEDSHIGLASAKAAGFFAIGVFDKASEQHWDSVRMTADLAAHELRQVYYAMKNAYGRQR